MLIHDDLDDINDVSPKPQEIKKATRSQPRRLLPTTYNETKNDYSSTGVSLGCEASAAGVSAAGTSAPSGTSGTVVGITPEVVRCTCS